MKKILTLIPLVALCGCVIVPHTRLHGTVMGEPYSINSPKDSELTGLSVDASVDMGGVKHVTIKVESLKARMNPDVISAQGVANSAITALYFNGFNQGLNTAANAYLGHPPTVISNSPAK